MCHAGLKRKHKHLFRLMLEIYGDEFKLCAIFFYKFYIIQFIYYGMSTNLFFFSDIIQNFVEVVSFLLSFVWLFIPEMLAWAWNFFQANIELYPVYI